MSERQAGDASQPPRSDRSRSGLGSRRVVTTSFAISFAIHVVVIFLLFPAAFERVREGQPAFAPPIPLGPPQGAEVIRLVDIEPIDPTEPDEPEEIEELETPEDDAPTPEFELPPIEVGPPGPTAADRLRPQLVDARLWAAPPEGFFDLTLEQREELILANRISEWLDSVRVAEEAEAALTDWTFTDEDGGRWGVSPGKIHLGDVTLPLPINFGVPVGQRDRTNQLVWQWEEIMRQAARADVEISWRERAEAIRTRRDRERALARPDTLFGR